MEPTSPVRTTPDAEPRKDPPRQSPLRKLFAPLLVAGVVLVKFAGPALKFLPVILKTGGTMLLSIWFYAMNWGWPFAVGFVGLIAILAFGMHVTHIAPPAR